MYRPANRDQQIGKLPEEIVTWLKLSNPEAYTDHSFWCTAATVYADTEANMTSIKKFCGWSSTGVAEGLFNSLMNRLKCPSNIIMKSL